MTPDRHVASWGALARRLSALAFVLGGGASPAPAQLTPVRLYYGFGQRVTVEVDAPPESADDLRITLHDPASGRVVRESPAALGQVDLAGLFPEIWSDRSRVVLAQLHAGTGELGPPLVVQPMVTPDVAERRDPVTLERDERGEPVFESAWRRARAARTGETPRPRQAVLSGVRVYPERLVRLTTDLGEMTFRLRPDDAPNTAFNFMRLVEGGFYDGVAFHRVVDRLADGSRFVVQFGDPSGTGSGGPGYRIDLEPSPLEHGYGVLSMARAGDPDSGGSQVFICLSRAGTAALDGKYTAFGELVEGAETLEAIASVPTGEGDRPLVPPVIVHAEAVEAPPVDERPAPIAAPPGDAGHDDDR